MKKALPATFILSLDCEGKWGMADAITDHHRKHFVNDRICKTYRDLVHLLGALDLSATFAFVGAFTLSAEQYQEHIEGLAWSPAAKAWLKQLERDVQDRNYEGWFVPEALDIVCSAGTHEIASHGFTHLTFDEAIVDQADADRELRSALQVAALKGVTPRTFIYPRNIVGYPDTLFKHGFVAYRNGYAAVRTAAQVVRGLVTEVSPFTPGQPHSAAKRHPLCLPSGYFVNWRRGVRKHIPIVVTSVRWRRIIDDAIRKNGVAHAWLHPHNLIDGDGQFRLLERILTDVSRRVKAGDIRNMTQAEYAQLVCLHSPE